MTRRRQAEHGWAARRAGTRPDRGRMRDVDLEDDEQQAPLLTCRSVTVAHPYG